MEKEQIGKRSMRLGAMPAQQPSAESVKRICNWVKLFGEHFRQEISESSTIAYIEGLKDLRPGQVDFCCERTLKEAHFMPCVADIRQRLYLEQPSGNLGYLDEEPIGEEERLAALEFSQKLKRAIVEMEEREAKPKPVAYQARATFPYHEAYVLWLEEQAAADEQTRREGGLPLPRSEEERLAIFYNLPLAERKRMQRKAEWTRVAIKNT